MNIVVKTADEKYIVRPDTTWEKDAEDLYVPEFVNQISYTPVLFVRISKPGRSVSAKFASRYYDAVGYGVLLYPEDMLDGSETGFACASCLDHTSFLTAPFFSPDTLGKEYHLKAGDKEIFSHAEGTAEMVEKAIEEATRFIYIRTGDLLAIELQPRKQLVSRDEESVELSSSFAENELASFKIIF